MRFQYLIWDFDGTLFDTYPPLNLAIRLGLADLGVKDCAEDTVAALLSETLSHCLTQLAEQYGLDQAELDARATAHHVRMPLADPFPGVKLVCERFAEAGGQNYIITHRGRASLLEYLSRHNMESWFADAITRDDGFPRKPDPAAFVALVNKHHLVPAEGLSIGDRTLDVLAAQGAGVRTCWYGPTPPPAVVQPDYSIQTFAELETILGI